MIYISIYIYTLWLFNIAMERSTIFNRYIIYKWVIFQFAMYIYIYGSPSYNIMGFCSPSYLTKTTENPGMLLGPDEKFMVDFCHRGAIYPVILWSQKAYQ